MTKDLENTLENPPHFEVMELRREGNRGICLFVLFFFSKNVVEATFFFLLEKNRVRVNSLPHGISCDKYGVLRAFRSHSILGFGALMLVTYFPTILGGSVQRTTPNS